jgi:hypothetical protein
VLGSQLDLSQYSIERSHHKTLPGFFDQADPLKDLNVLVHNRRIPEDSNLQCRPVLAQRRKARKGNPKHKPEFRMPSNSNAFWN